MLPGEIASCIAGEMARVLRPRGFRPKAHVFSRESEDVIHLVELQSSQKNTRALSFFTVNLALWVPALVPEDVRDSRRPSVAGAPWRKRLGAVCPEQTDLWWQASERKAASDIASEIASRVEQFGLPALQALPNARALAALWRSGSTPGLTKLEAGKLAAELQECIGEP